MIQYNYDRSRYLITFVILTKEVKLRTYESIIKPNSNAHSRRDIGYSKQVIRRNKEKLE